MKKTKARNWEVLIYPEDLDLKEDIKYEIFKERLDYYLTNIKIKYAGIIHDNDIKEDGEKKKQHAHVIVIWSNTTTKKAVSDSLNISENRINKINNLNLMYEYLTHKNDRNKYQYDKNEIIKSQDFEEVDIIEKKKSDKLHDLKYITKFIEENEITNIISLINNIEFEYLEYIQDKAYLINLIINTIKEKKRGLL